MPSPRRLRAALAVAACSAVVPMAAPALADAAPAGPSAAKNCTAPRYPGQGYFTSLKVTSTSCATGKKVALAHYRCRIKKGVKGRCTSRPLDFRCAESRQSIATEFNSRVTCRRGARKVVFTYQQNT